MFILANLKIIAFSVLMAIPFYFFNRYLVLKFKPTANAKSMIRYFAIVIITALLYSLAGALIIGWIGFLNR